MAEQDEEPPKLRIRFERSEGHRVVAITGAYGSLTPSGSIFVDFYHEHVEHPAEVERDQTRPGERRVGPSISYVPMSRTVEFSAILDAGVAHQIGKWLQEKADEANRALDEGKKEQESKG